jgi:hypothetical protein
MSDADITQWSSIKRLTRTLTQPLWIPDEEKERVSAYEKYDEIYWNTSTQYLLRVLDGEQPLYIPNARIVVDTTSHYLLKGLELVYDGPKAEKDILANFLKRETFYSRFHTAKQAGVARGDFVFHLTANPKKADGTRLSLNSVHPGNCFPIYDEDEPDKMIGCSLATSWLDPKDSTKTFVRVLRYQLEEKTLGNRRVIREEAIYSLDENWWGPRAKKVKQLIPKGYLDEKITAIPVYWFKNRHWQGEDFGSSEIRGFETIMQVISQGSTDVTGALSLEGLGVYATDGGRPVDDGGGETDWEVAPGKVMEVPQGSYFRRVEGVGSITPAKDQIEYLEQKMMDAEGLSDVALGKVDALTAQSGIALAIRFQPTLAKIEIRDQHSIDILTQLFYDWKTWYAVFERQQLDGDIIPSIGDKLPTDRVAKLNELNNMKDRGIISNKFYRSEMEKIGYKFPANIEDEIAKEAQVKAEAARQAFVASQGGDPNSPPGAPLPGAGGAAGTLPSSGNRSNNAAKPNESAGTEANNARDAQKGN